MKILYFLYPFFLTLFPILSFFDKNKFELTLDVLIFPALIFLTSALILFWLLFLAFRNWQKSSILTSIILILFFSLRHFKNIIPKLSDGLIVIAFILVIVVFSNILAKTQKKLDVATKALAVVSFFLFLIPAISILRYLPNLKFTEPKTEIPTKQIVKEKGNLSDIYYIILDRYAGSKTLKEYGFDNTAFISYLENKGFFVASQSISNYPSTTFSLASTLNVCYLDDLAVKEGEESKNWNPARSLLRNNQVISFLKERGYAYVHLGSWWGPTQKNDLADFNFFYETPARTEFLNRFLETTIYPTVANIFLPEEFRVSFRNEHKNSAMYQFEKIKEIVNINGPKFVLIHILLPHSPYVFNAQCKFLSERQAKQKEELEKYLNQLECLNTRLKSMIDIILGKSGKPIVILQSDEGPHPIRAKLKEENDWKNANETALKEKFRILNAYYLPNIDKNMLSPTLSPINTFRLVFNLYFNSDFELLPQKTFIFEDKNHIYKFREVTNQIVFE